MASFNQIFDGAVKKVQKAEKERSKFIHGQGYRTYRDMKQEETDPDVLRMAADDCQRVESAYLGVVNLAKRMSRAMAKEAESLNNAADDLE
jgi:hypothetical protein